MRVILTALFWLCHQSLDKFISEWVMWGSWLQPWIWCVWWFDLFPHSQIDCVSSLMQIPVVRLLRLVPIFSTSTSHTMKPSTASINWCQRHKNTHNYTWSFGAVLSLTVAWSAQCDLKVTFWYHRRQDRWGIFHRCLQRLPALYTGSGRTCSCLARCTSARRLQCRTPSRWSSYSCRRCIQRGTCTPHSDIPHDLNKRGAKNKSALVIKQLL